MLKYKNLYRQKNVEKYFHFFHSLSENFGCFAKNREVIHKKPPGSKFLIRYLTFEIHYSIFRIPF